MQQSDEMRRAAGYNQTLARNPNDFAALYSLGVMRAQQGQATEARALLERALAQLPNEPDALVAYGNLLGQAGDSEGALQFYNRALLADPGHIDASINMGVCLHGRRQYEEALAAYDGALLADPGNIVGLVNRALALHALGRFIEAIATLDYALMVALDGIDILIARGDALLAAGRLDDARRDYQRVLELGVPDPQAQVGLANVAAAQGDLEGGLKALTTVLQAHPGHVEAHFYRGNILRDLKRLPEAVAAYDAALRHAPDFVRAQRNKGLCLLLAGNFVEGLPLYEWRKQLPVPVEARHYPAPVWTGEQDISGKTLFVYIEQGLGDTIQFARFLPVLEKQGARVILSCQDQLSQLLASADGGAQIIGSGEVPSHFDFHCPLPSVPLTLNMCESTIPAAAPYLRADPDLARRWLERIGPSGFKIGIAWQGAVGIDDARSFAPELFQPIGALPGVRLISLQKGEAVSQRITPGMTVEDLEPFDNGPQAFLDAAAIMASLDLVACCDTSIAHLAGALGRPTCVMLKQVPDWRWMLDRPDTPWYPTLRLFRQPAFADWHGAFAILKDHVMKMAKKAS